ncbi:unnamed protein product [Didymodactylos carnosus]|uniref:Uncharacterized protein n=1 Tax=Didymodactylos carnosus TaxID=1234261 RepID=A0A8S2L2Y1_9BILA|nr:unnamed protein product [Didymodactylos carnosus]CAF3881122.1 unnamed protein product [Didymodactylos carnosus]
MSRSVQERKPAIDRNSEWKERFPHSGSAYKTVEINPDLQPKNITYGHLLPLNTLWLAEIEREHFFTHLLTRFNDDAKYGKKSHYKLQYTRKNGPYNSKSSNPILQAFMNAYNNHEDLILSPDDIWLLITINYAKYVNSNSELLRHFFVEHEGKKTLTVIEDVCKDENDWTDFFGNMKKEIEKGVKNSSIVNTLISNYSTTTQVESILSFATIMDTFKNYFDYGRFIPTCGIRQIHFMGTIGDWYLLKRKTEQIRSYTTVNDSFYLYIENLLPILEEFIQTYQNNVNISFWNIVMNTRRIRADYMCTSGEETRISGWILKLFYDVDKNDEVLENIKLNSIKAPVLVENRCTCQKKTCYVMGGFHGVYSDGHTHKPVMSLQVIEDLSTVVQIC